MKINKKSQAWGIDLVFAFIIFSVGIMIFFVYSINQTGEAKEKFDSLTVDGDFILNNILSEGYPIDWNSSNVIIIGIISDGKINNTKLERFYNLSLNNYTTTISKFRTRYNYYFSFDNMSISSGAINGIGKSDVNTSNNVIRITRYSIYNNKPTVVKLDIGGN